MHRILMQEYSDAACTVPIGELMSRLVRATGMTELQITAWYHIANTEGWPFGMSSVLPNSQGYFKTGEIFDPEHKSANLLTTWVLNNAGIHVQHFNGDGLDTSNSRVRYVEFVDFFTTFEASGAKYQADVKNGWVGKVMAEIAVGAARLLSDLRDDRKPLRVIRCFVNVMDKNEMCGAGLHCDLEASMGTVVVKLSGEDTLEGALHIFPPNSGGTGTPLQLKKGEGVAFLPMVQHSVPSVKRSSTRVTINFFFQTDTLHSQHP
jgi:hypothetical protein